MEAFTVVVLQRMALLGPFFADKDSRCLNAMHPKGAFFQDKRQQWARMGPFFADKPAICGLIVRHVVTCRVLSAL